MNLNRRAFLSGLSALVGGIALEQAIPFGRVWSFPSRVTRRLPVRDYPLVHPFIVGDVPCHLEATIIHPFCVYWEGTRVPRSSVSGFDRA